MSSVVFPRPFKHPLDSARWGFDWTDELGFDNEIIESIEVSSNAVAVEGTATPSLVLSGAQHTTNKVEVRIAGGVLGEKYLITCKVTTDLGRVYDRTAKLTVKHTIDRPTIFKDATETIERDFDWTESFSHLADTIQTVGLSVANASPNTIAPLVIEGHTFADTVVSVEMSGGQLRKSYVVWCKVTTAQGDTFYRGMKVSVKDL